MPARRFLEMAVAFLQDAVEAQGRSKEEPGTIHAESMQRYLIGAVVMLRTCHENSGEDLKTAQGQDMLEFVRVSRHVLLHTGQVPQALGKIRTDVELDLVNDRAHFTAEGGVFQLDLIEASKGLNIASGAARQGASFLARHENNWFVAMVAACRETSTWLAIPVPTEPLASQKLNRMVHRIQAKDTAATLRWLRPQLEAHRRASPPDGPILQKSDLDPEGLERTG